MAVILQRTLKMRRIFPILLFSVSLSIIAPVTMAMPDPQVSRIDTNSSSPAVQGGAGHIYFWAGNSNVVFNVYSITGQLLRQVRVGTDQHVSIEMPKGFYLVRCGTQWSVKVVVK